MSRPIAPSRAAARRLLRRASGPSTMKVDRETNNNPHFIVTSLYAPRCFVLESRIFKESQNPK